MKHKILILLPLLCLLTACGRGEGQPVNTERIPGNEQENQVVWVQEPAMQRSAKGTSREGGQSRDLDFRTLYRGFSLVSLDDRASYEAFSEFGVKAITNAEDWDGFMNDYCPGIPYEEPIDFEKDYAVATIILGSRPGYASADRLNGLVWNDGYFLFSYENDPSGYVYALNGEGFTHFYVEVVLVSREDVPWVEEEQCYCP